MTSAGRPVLSNVDRGEAVTRRLEPTGAEVYAERDQAERSYETNTAKENNCLERVVICSRFGN